MELTNDLITLQGILNSTVTTTGQFTAISHRGGNEEKIKVINQNIAQFLTSKTYLRSDKPDPMFDKELEDIVTFLALNTNFLCTFEVPEYTHLLNIIPRLSKCVFSNIIYELNLCKYFCAVIEKFPFKLSAELIDEMMICSTKAIPKKELDFSQMVLNAVKNRLDIADPDSDITKDDMPKFIIEDDLNGFLDVVNVLVLNLVSLQQSHIFVMEPFEVNAHMGYCLLHLFDLLLKINHNSPFMLQFASYIAQAAATMMLCVTLNVFCTWVEIDIGDKNLQEIIAEKAYLIIEKYTINKKGQFKELISMLGGIAKKPLTLSEQIAQATTSTIINKVNEDQVNRKTWFKALITNRVLINEDAVKCIEKWPHLCDGEDVTLLLNQCIKMNDFQIKKLVVRCASTLEATELNVVLIKYFNRNRFSHILTDNVDSDLIIVLLNKLNQYSTSNLEQEISVQFLQNPASVLKHIYRECLKSDYYTRQLANVFKSLSEILTIDNFGLEILLEIILNDKLNSNNVTHCSVLLKELIATNCFTKIQVFTNIIYPLLKLHYELQQSEELCSVLQLTSTFLTLPINYQTRELLELLLAIMATHRCTVQNFVALNQECVRYVVDIFMDLCEVNNNPFIEDIQILNHEDHYLKFYKNYLLTGSDEFYEHYCPNFAHSEGCIHKMVNVLPSAVPREWVSITDEFVRAFGQKRSLELLTDMMVLLVETVEKKNDNVCLALQYCVKNFGLAIQKNIQNNSDLQLEIEVALQVCKLLCVLPDKIKEEEGPLLISLLTDRSLKSLTSNKDFLCRLVLIKNTNICKMIAGRTKN